MSKDVQIENLAKAAFALMSDNDVPPTPDNYELFYLYISGENPAATRVIGDMIDNRGTFTPLVLRGLYERCLQKERTARTMEEVGANISITLDMVLDKLETAGKQAGDYGRALSVVSGELGGDKSPDAIRKLVDGLIGATKAMESRTRTLEDELQRSSQQVNELKGQLDTVRKETKLDALTGIANRKAFDTALEEAVANSLSTGEPVSLMMCDIDHFKVFNDTWGHQTGDQVLRLVAGCLSENVKGRDLAARYGGEEFVVLLRQTGIDDAINLANQIRAGVENKKLIKKSTGDILGSITISIGVAQMNNADTGESLVKRADTCLYRAKNTGRNRVIGQSRGTAAAA